MIERMSRTKLLARLRAISPIGRSSGGFDLQRLAAPVLTVVICVLLLVVFQHLSRSVDYKSVIHSLRMMTNSTDNQEPKWRHRRPELTTGYKATTYNHK